MRLENKWYLVIGFSAVFYLLGLAIVVHFFTHNLVLPLIVMILICTGLSLLATYYIGEAIEQVAFTRKGIIISIIIFIMFFLAILEVILLYFPLELFTFLIGGAVWLVISLVIVYITIRELEPIEDTSKAEIAIVISIVVVGIVIITVFFLDNLIGILLMAIICLTLYLFIFLAIEFYITER